MSLFGFDSSGYDPFDFNRDGQRSPDEDFMEYMIFTEAMNYDEKRKKKDDEEDDNFVNGFRQ